MRITILNGTPHPENRFETYIDEIMRELEKGGNRVKLITLRDIRLHHCIGCFGCWVKTPGQCVHRDDGPAMLTEIINADLVILASPLIMGFSSALLKKAMDRSLPLIHPYFELVKGEVHHKKRYTHYPLIGIIVEPAGREDDLDLVRDVFCRFAINFKSNLSFCLTTETKISEAVHEINCA